MWKVLLGAQSHPPPPVLLVEICGGAVVAAMFTVVAAAAGAACGRTCRSRAHCARWPGLVWAATGAGGPSGSLWGQQLSRERCAVAPLPLHLYIGRRMGRVAVCMGWRWAAPLAVWAMRTPTLPGRSVCGVGAAPRSGGVGASEAAAPAVASGAEAQWAGAVFGPRCNR